MSNLIPTPIVDKNGVASTRHKKPASAPTSAAGIPAPSMAMGQVVPGSNRDFAKQSPSTNEPPSSNVLTQGLEKLKRKKVINSLVREIFEDISDVYEGMSRDSLSHSMEQFLTTEEVQRAIDLVRLTKHKGASARESQLDRKNLLYSFRTTMSIQRNGALITDMHTHSDWLVNHPGELHKLRDTVEDMAALGMLSADGLSRIENIDRYVAARHHLAYADQEIAPSWREDYFNAAARHPERIDDIVTYMKACNGFIEDGFEDFLSAAEKHPDDVDKMIDYMRGRNVFDEAGFEQYVNTSVPLADGAL